VSVGRLVTFSISSAFALVASFGPVAFVFVAFALVAMVFALVAIVFALVAIVVGLVVVGLVAVVIALLCRHFWFLWAVNLLLFWR
jgi:hypothetical protein